MPRSNSRLRSKAMQAACQEAGSRVRRDADAAFQKNDYSRGHAGAWSACRGRAGGCSSWLRLAAPFFRSNRVMIARKPCCSIAVRQPPMSRISESSRSQFQKRIASRFSVKALADRQQWRGALNSCVCHSNCAKRPSCAANMKSCEPSMGFGSSISPSTRIRFRREPVFNFRRSFPAGARTFHRLSWSRGWTGLQYRQARNGLCVEGLKHGERYAITLRPGLPSVVKDTLAKSAEFTIFVRDRKPFVRFSGKAYVLPRSGQRGIPVLSMNTKAVALSIYKIGNR